MGRLLVVLAAVILSLSLAPVATGTGLLCIVDNQFVDCGPVVPIIVPTTVAQYRPRYQPPLSPTSVALTAPTTIPATTTPDTTASVNPSTTVTLPAAAVLLPAEPNAPVSQGTVWFLKALGLASLLLLIAHAARYFNRHRYRPLHRVRSA